MDCLTCLDGLLKMWPLSDSFALESALNTTPSALTATATTPARARAGATARRRVADVGVAGTSTNPNPSLASYANAEVCVSCGVSVEAGRSKT